MSYPRCRARCSSPVPSAPATAQSPQVLGPQDTQGPWGQGAQVLGHLVESGLQGHLQGLALWLEHPEDRPQLDDGTCLTQGTEYHSVAFKTDAFWVQIDLPFVPLN